MRGCRSIRQYIGTFPPSSFGALIVQLFNSREKSRGERVHMAGSHASRRPFPRPAGRLRGSRTEGRYRSSQTARERAQEPRDRLGEPADLECRTDADAAYGEQKNGPSTLWYWAHPSTPLPLMIPYDRSRNFHFRNFQPWISLTGDVDFRTSQVYDVCFEGYDQEMITDRGNTRPLCLRFWTDHTTSYALSVL